MEPVAATLALWGYAETDPTLVGVLVAIVVASGLGFVVRRWWTHRRR